MSGKEFGILFRKPAFPVIGLVDGMLVSARTLKPLALILMESDPISDDDIIKLIDSTGEEFWYLRRQKTLSPGFMVKRWTKQKIIDLYNRHIGTDRSYQLRSLSNKRLAEIIAEISDLIQRP